VGEHVIQAEGLDTNGAPKAIAAGVIVADDEDGDLVDDPVDQCPGTAPGADVDAEGCSEEQRGDDQEVLPVPGLNTLHTVLLGALLSGLGLWVWRRRFS